MIDLLCSGQLKGSGDVKENSLIQSWNFQIPFGSEEQINR